MLFDKSLFAFGSEQGIPLRNTIQATMVAGVRSPVDTDTGYDSRIDGRVYFGSCTSDRIKSLYDIPQSDKEDAEMKFQFFPFGTGRNNIYSFEYRLLIQDSLVLDRVRGIVHFSHPPVNVSEGGVSDNRVLSTFELGDPMFAFKYIPKPDGYFYGFDCVQCSWPNVFPDNWKSWLLSGTGRESHQISFTDEYFDGEKKFETIVVPNSEKNILPFGFQANESYDITVSYSDILWQAGEVEGGGKHLIFRASNRSLFKEAA